jgi:hypothetical protein
MMPLAAPSVLAVLSVNFSQLATPLRVAPVSSAGAVSFDGLTTWLGQRKEAA